MAAVPPWKERLLGLTVYNELDGQPCAIIDVSDPNRCTMRNLISGYNRQVPWVQIESGHYRNADNGEAITQ